MGSGSVGPARTWDPAARPLEVSANDRLAGLRVICASPRRRSRAQPSHAAAPRDSRSTAATIDVPGRCDRGRTWICSGSGRSSACRRWRPIGTRAPINGHIVASGSGTIAGPPGHRGDDEPHGERHVARHGDHGRADSSAGVRCHAAAGHGAREGDRLVRRLRSGGRQRQAGDEGHGRRHARRRWRRSRTSRRASRRTACRRPRRSTSSRRPSAVLDITSADIDADYHDSTADIRTLDIVGRDVNVQASGTLALNETGQSNLTVHADSPEPGADREAPRPAARRHRHGRCDGDRQQARAAGRRHGRRQRREVR